MEQLQLSRLSAKFKRNVSLQHTTKYNLWHAHVKMVTKMKDKNRKKSETEKKLWSSGTIKEEKVIRKMASKGDHRKTRAQVKEAERYKTIDTSKKRELLREPTNNYYTSKNKTIDSSIEQFKMKWRKVLIINIFRM